MHYLLITIFITMFSVSAMAEKSVYDSLSELSMLTDGFKVVEMPSGIDLKSTDTFKNSTGKVEPVTHMEFEGPFNNPNIQNLEQGMDFLVNLVKQEIDSTYVNKNNIIPGLDVVIVDVNGSKVGLIDYKMNREPNTYVKRAVMYTKKGLYSYALIMHQSQPKDKKGLLLMAAVIASVNSGAL